MRFFAAEKGIPLQLESISIANNEHLQPNFIAINRVSELPVLELDDGTRITESLAICRFLEAQQPEPNLLGRSALERAQIEQWTLRLMFRLYVPLTQVYRNTHPFWADRLTQVPPYGELARSAVLAELTLLDAHMRGREFFAAERFTMADIVACTSIDFGKPSKIRIGPEHTELLRWHASTSARPAARS